MAKKNELLEALTRGSVTIDIQTNKPEIEKATMQLINKGQESNQSLIANMLLNGKGVSQSDQAVIAKALEKAIAQLLLQSAGLKNQNKVKQDSDVSNVMKKR